MVSFHGQPLGLVGWRQQGLRDPYSYDRGKLVICRRPPLRSESAAATLRHRGARGDWPCDCGSLLVSIAPRWHTRNCIWSSQCLAQEARERRRAERSADYALYDEEQLSKRPIAYLLKIASAARKKISATALEHGHLSLEELMHPLGPIGDIVAAVSE
jgi:hypothetical protein